MSIVYLYICRRRFGLTMRSNDSIKKIVFICCGSIATPGIDDYGGGSRAIHTHKHSFSVSYLSTE